MCYDTIKGTVCFVKIWSKISQVFDVYAHSLPSNNSHTEMNYTAPERVKSVDYNFIVIICVAQLISNRTVYILPSKVVLALLGFPK